MGLIRNQVWNFHDFLVGEFSLGMFNNVHLTINCSTDPSVLLFSMDNVQPGVLEQYSELNGEFGAS
jgi:hypothetical protein